VNCSYVCSGKLNFKKTLTQFFILHKANRKVTPAQTISLCSEKGGTLSELLGASNCDEIAMTLFLANTVAHYIEIGAQ